MVISRNRLINMISVSMNRGGTEQAYARWSRKERTRLSWRSVTVVTTECTVSFTLYAFFELMPVPVRPVANKLRIL